MNQVIPLAGVITRVWVANLVAPAGQEDGGAGKGWERAPKGPPGGETVEYREKHIPHAEGKHASC